jgi:hypothetical protein
VLPGAGGEQKEAREKYAQGLLILVVNEALSRFRKAANGPRPLVPRPCRGGETLCANDDETNCPVKFKLWADRRMSRGHAESNRPGALGCR